MSEKAKAWASERFPIWAQVGDFIEAHDGDCGMVRIAVSEIEQAVS